MSRFPPIAANQRSWFLTLKVVLPVRRVIKEIPWCTVEGGVEHCSFRACPAVADNGFGRSLCHGDSFGKQKTVGTRGYLKDCIQIQDAKTNSLHLKMVVGRLFSIWDGLFSGDMLVLGRVLVASITIDPILNSFTTMALPLPWFLLKFPMAEDLDVSISLSFAKPFCDKVKLKDFKIKTMILRWYHQNMFYIYVWNDFNDQWMVPASCLFQLPRWWQKNKNLILIAPLKDTAVLDTNAGMYAIQVLQPTDANRVWLTTYDIGYTVCYMKMLYNILGSAPK